MAIYSQFFWTFFCLATAYNRPEAKPMKMDMMDRKFLGASKKIKPARAIGNLFKAPTIE